ncbi:Dbl homology domain-containing protein [Mucor mucedo]|uniref:Dbl homology domain-containing protein n=1 Tax=Mucor mucedo TaxID=29922 RepID=UPI00221E7FED|nr:Dbl homology domain-containing protein [Mucor mucedo]KAI7896749.1 Dbl homology domain-containing protein [Mucor mucedo]
MSGQNGVVDTSQPSIADTISPRPHRKIQGLSIGSTASTTSIASSNASRYTTSGMTATSTFSSIDEHDQISTNSSAIGFLNDSVEDQDFGLIDTLDYEDVDEGIIDHEYIHRDRENLIESLLASEQAYLESLELVMKLFLVPLKKDAKQSSFNFLGMKKMVCTEREFRWLFGNFEELVHTHRLILKSLQERLRIWGPTQILSDVFQAWFPNIECYRLYLKNYDVSLTTYERLTRYQPFKKFIDTVHKDKDLKGSSLLSLIQLPAGCISRYADIISRLADLTPALHPDYSGLRKSKAYIQHYRTTINEKLLDADNVDQVLMIHRALIGAPFNVRAERRLVIQGQLSRVTISTRSMGEERNYMLFNDLLLFVKPKVEGKVTRLQYKGHLTLERAKIRSLTKEEAGGIAHCIEITCSMAGVDNLNSTFVGASTTHVLYIGSDRGRDVWLKSLDLVILNLDKIAMAKHAQTTRRMIQSRTPRGSNSNSATTSTLSSNDSLKTVSRESSHRS